MIETHNFLSTIIYNFYKQNLILYNLCTKHRFSRYRKTLPDVASVHRDQREDADTFKKKRKRPINRYRQSKGDNLRIKGRNRDDSIEKKKKENNK